MSDFVDGLFFRLACEQPLPRSTIQGRRADKASTAKPYTRAQARSEQQTESLQCPLFRTPTANKKRTRKPEFEILIDTNIVQSTPVQSPKKPKTNERVPLAIRTDSANVTPVPSPRCSSTPFPLLPSDPLWENVENYDPRPYLMTPPPTPVRRSPAPENSATAPPPPPSLPRRSPRTVQSRRPLYTRPLLPPVDMTLYNVLELENWRATEEEIKAAYKKLARNNHPDKVPEEQREDATQLMQTVNAAKEVLLDSKRRRAYHRNAKLPWTT
ncbi:DnaJ domain-containing protein [Boeremia exigua]|uniref:DnaJ domain-containing protein n=1 Tax=Boeremia exigua TaxID=749465 RepID=UPI001E8D4EA5|nr:DnaJ domain-containing protein [Boeremia exigua]KAH6629201.1 DnaJ domain-containing protein [Boeremia exigua]